MVKTKKTKAFPRVKVTESEFDEVNQVLEILDVPYAQFAREAIRERVAVLKSTDPRLQTPELNPAVNQV